MNVEDFLDKQNYPSYVNEGGFGRYYVKDAMIKFAAFHVKKALEMAYFNAEMRISEDAVKENPIFSDVYQGGNVSITISKKSIIKAYPLKNIQ